MDSKGKERGILKLDPRPRVIIDPCRSELTPQYFTTANEVKCNSNISDLQGKTDFTTGLLTPLLHLSCCTTVGKGSSEHGPSSPQPSVDRLSVTWAEPGSMTSSGVNLFHLPSETPVSNEVKFSPSAGDGSEDEDYSASLSAVLRQRRASVRRSRKGRARRPSSPFLPDEARPRRRSSVFTTSSGDTAISMEEAPPIVTQEQIFENIHLHKVVLGSVKQQPLGMRRKLKIVHQARGYIKRHEGQLQERLAQSKSTRDIYARFNILIAAKWQQLKREAANTSNLMIPWELRIKEIESHFGSVVASYFTFLRWLFWVNLVIGFILLVFVIVPEYLTANPQQDGERKVIMEEERENATNLLTLWEFEGILKCSPIFYGYYSNIERPQYRMPLAYFLTGLAVYIYSFVAILRKMAENSRMSKLSEKEDECIFSWKLFTGWDFMIGNAETAHNRIASVILGFKEALLEEAEKKKDLRNWRIISLRALVNVCVVLLLVISAYAVVYVVSRSDDEPKHRSWWRENETTTVVTVISITFPLLFELLGMLEHYHPRKQLRLQLARIMLLNLLNLYSLIFALFSKIEGMSDDLLLLKPTLIINAIKPNNTLIHESANTTNPCVEEIVSCGPCSMQLIITAINGTPVNINSIHNTTNSEDLKIYLDAYSTDATKYVKSDTDLVAENLETYMLNNMPLSTIITGLPDEVRKEIDRLRILIAETEKNSTYTLFTEDPIDTSDIDDDGNYFDNNTLTDGNNIDKTISNDISTTSTEISSSETDIPDENNTTPTSDIFPSSDMNSVIPDFASEIYSSPVLTSETYSTSDITSEIYSPLNVTSEIYSSNFTSDTYSFPDFTTESFSFPNFTDEAYSSSVVTGDTYTSPDLYTGTYRFPDITETIEISESQNNSNYLTTIVEETTYSTQKTHTTSTKIAETAQPLNTTTKITTIGSGRYCPEIAFNCTTICGEKNITQVFSISNCSIINRVCYERKCDSTIQSENMTKNETVDVVIIDEKQLKQYNLSRPTRKKLLKLCWETMFGQELIKLTMMDLVFVLLGTLFMDFFRALFVRYMNRCWCWDLEKKFPEYGDFKIAENILHLINNQGMVWMGMFFSPGLVVLNVVKLMIMMYLRSWAVMTCNVPHEVVFRVSKSNNFYLALLLTMLFLCVLPVGYTIVWVKPSWHCGPFSEYDKIYHILTSNLYKILPTKLNFALEYIASPAIVIPLLVLLILIIYYLTSLTNSLREANNDLKIQLRRERTEERRKMFQLADTRRRVGSSAMDNTPFARWKKALPSLPLSKSIDSDDRKTITADENIEPLKTVKKKGGIFAKIVNLALDKKSDVSATSDAPSPFSYNLDDETDTDFHETLPKEILKMKDIKIAKHFENKKKNSVEFKTDDTDKRKDDNLKVSLQSVNETTDKKAVAQKQLKDRFAAIVSKSKSPKPEEIKKGSVEDKKINEKQASESSTQSRQSDSIGSVIPVIMISTTESDEEVLQTDEKNAKTKERKHKDYVKQSRGNEGSQKKRKNSADSKSLRRQSSVDSIKEESIKEVKPEDGHKYQYSL